jgi:uncharacterized protein YndB with AHSA1/START domain
MNDSRQREATRESDDTDTVVVECDLPEPPEKVWRALTEPELVAEWLAPDEGAADEHAPNERAPFECEVIELRPNRLVRYSWRDAGAPGDEDGGLDSIVTFELARTAAGGTHLRIIHTAFEQMPALAMAA